MAARVGRKGAGLSSDSDEQDLPDEQPATPSEEARQPPGEGPEEAPQLPEFPLPIWRIGAVVAFPTLATAAMAGGVFIGIGARIWAAIAGLAGIVLALEVRKIRRQLFLGLLIAAGLLGIGVVAVVLTGFGNLFDLGKLVEKAVKSGDVQRPPVLFDAGWRAILTWLMGGVGFAAAWTAIELRKPAMALTVPLPVAAITAISVPKDEQVITGLVGLVFFAIGLGLLSGTEFDGESEKRSMAYELRRAARAVPLLTAVTVGLYFLSTAGFLFPPPRYDPTQEAQRPKTVPIQEVKDRPLFRVQSTVTGPWRTGHLDVYDGKDWRLPPFAQSLLTPVPKSGVVDLELVPGIVATFQIADLGGAVLPGLPGTVGIKAEGPKLAFDSRLGNIRLVQGVIEPGLKYTVVSAKIPTVEQLAKVEMDNLPDEIDGLATEDLLDVPPPPPAVASLLRQAASKKSAWEKLDFLRLKLLKTVVSSGTGTPVSITPRKVDDMLAASKQGSPFEIVAAQAMLARWVGVPSRIGYGFDGGERLSEEVLEVRPKHGASYLEVYFPIYKWLPVIGTPLQAKSNLGNEFQQFDPNVQATDEVGVKIYLPIALDPRNLLFRQVRAILLVVLPILGAMLAAYYAWPGFRKAYLRGRRRTWAKQQGTRERVALAYAEWRDTASDFGYLYPSDTPLMFLDRVIEDSEHTELAWLVTRALWGDLREDRTEDEASAAEELSRSLRVRLSQAHTLTLRGVALVSRLSLRHPWAPSLGEPGPSSEEPVPVAAGQKEEVESEKLEV